MITSDIQPDRDSFITAAPYFPLMCGLEFLPRPVRLDRESQEDFGQLSQLAKVNNWQFDRQRIQLFLQNPSHALIITDIRQSIQFVNRGFSRMTGYDSSEALNRYPAFLQGANTDTTTKTAIRASLVADQPFTGDILNYRKSGEPYWCRVAIEPIVNQKRQVVHYVAFEREVKQPARTFGFKM